MNYDRSWDCPHDPSSEPAWQESDCYWFYDNALGVGGFHRIGQTPNTGMGQVDLFVFARGGERYLLDPATKTRPIDKGDRWATGHRVDGHVAESLGDKVLKFAWKEPGCTGDLEFYESFYAPRNWSKDGHSDAIMSDINPDGHLECSGRIRGKIRIGALMYDIDALAHRDRSWGVRGKSGDISLHRYRMFSGAVGPELSFASFGLDSLQIGFKSAGFVVRDGVDEDVVDLRCITTFDYDGISPIGATAVLTLVGGEKLKLSVSPVQGRLGVGPGVGVSDTICTFEYAGKTGFVDLELCSNPGRGTYVPKPYDVSLLATTSGLSKVNTYEI
ncbi:MAG: hypothetical protein JWO83_1744 [Caulobacteraceae bacterium]|jgi:hypothetical protein|nr:hypothetical protein [Caulobacteraceae bacterium]